MSRGCCSILCCPLGNFFPVGRIEINNSNNKNRQTMHCLFLPLFWAFFLVVVDLLAVACSPSLGSELLGLDRLFISSGLEGWHLHLPHSFGGLGGAGFA